MSTPLFDIHVSEDDLQKTDVGGQYPFPPPTASTAIGSGRDAYGEAVERRPSRFRDPAAYKAWAARADEWAAQLLLSADREKP